MLNDPQPSPENNGFAPIWPLVIKDMQDRAEFGFTKYGVHLQPFNGRDPLIDLYQELLDAAVYLRQMLYERNGR